MCSEYPSWLINIKVRNTLMVYQLGAVALLCIMTVKSLRLTEKGFGHKMYASFTSTMCVLNILRCDEHVAIFARVGV
jgi:hypothetical protein